jgi:hypothetical protein
MLDEIISGLLLFIFLYAETHYRFRYFFSWLKKPEPEIIADIPSRIQLGHELPVLIIVKDGDKYPVRLNEIEVQFNNAVITQKPPNILISDPYYEYIFDLDTSKLNAGANALNVKINYQINDKIRTCVNDNHRGTSHDPFPLYVSESGFPKIDNAIIGETHAHTNFTSDQVEFGGSVAGTARLANALGLDFYCATDHSYDLDDLPNNYLVNDPDLKKWKTFQTEVREFNSQSDNFAIIPGEEVTIRNTHGRNVHCLVYNSAEFFPGSGDGAEKWFKWRSELSLEELTSKTAKNVFIFAAHPFEESPFLQRLFIGRDCWTDEDCTNIFINGLQVINGASIQLNTNARNNWIRLLLEGYHITAIAGNDAHGNFARFRQVGFPFFTMRENYEHLFGKWFTGLYDVHSFSPEDILKVMATGNCYLSNGPAIQFKLRSTNESWTYMGGQKITPEIGHIHVKSTKEFGDLSYLAIYYGNPDLTEEKVVYSNNEMPEYEFVDEIKLGRFEKNGYLRAELQTKSNHQALSNPIWIKPLENE